MAKKKKVSAKRLEDAVQETLKDRPELKGQEAEVEYELAMLLADES